MENFCGNNTQLRLIQKALDFYSRVGIGQFDQIKEHPTFETSLYHQCSSDKPLKVGDKTMRGEVVEIDKKRKWIKTKGSWGKGEEVKKWTDVENVKHSPDWEKLHTLEDEIDVQLNIARNLLYGEEMGRNGNWGIYNEKVDKSCVEAFDIIQKIRHAFWLKDENRNTMTVDSHEHITYCNNVKVEIDEQKQ